MISFFWEDEADSILGVKELKFFWVRVPTTLLESCKNLVCFLSILTFLTRMDLLSL